MGDDEVGVLGADFGAADAQALEPSLIDQGPGAEAAGVLEDAAAVLGVERLAVALEHPDFLGLLHDPLGIVRLKLKGGAENKRGDDIGAAVIEDQVVLRALKDRPL